MTSGSPSSELARLNAFGAADLVAALRKLNHDVGIPSLRALGISEERYTSLQEKMAADALASGSPACSTPESDSSWGQVTGKGIPKLAKMANFTTR